MPRACFKAGMKAMRSGGEGLVWGIFKVGLVTKGPLSAPLHLPRAGEAPTLPSFGFSAEGS